MSDKKAFPFSISATKEKQEQVDAEAKRLKMSRSAFVLMCVDQHFEMKMYKSLADWVAAQPDPVKEQS